MWLSKTFAGPTRDARTWFVLGGTALLLVLAGCGFQLRGAYNVPFASVFVAAPGTSQIAAKLRRELTNSPTRLVTAAKDAEAQLNITMERRDRIILSLSGAGRVREYQLKLTVQYQLVESKGAVAIPTSEILLQRILTYDDSQIIAKQQEEALLYQDMETDAMQQILRRMTAIKRPA
jgi:LPS-assembly lipoprotein